MAQTVRFILGDEIRELSDIDPTMTVLTYLRTVERRTGLPGRSLSAAGTRPAVPSAGEVNPAVEASPCSASRDDHGPFGPTGPVFS